MDGILHPTSAEQLVANVVARRGLQPQHRYKIKGVASYNFGISPYYNLKGEYICTENSNVEKASAELRALREALWPPIKEALETLAPGGLEQWRATQEARCPSIPPLLCDGERVPWNGQQVNRFHAATLHSDRTDMPGIPALVVFLGTTGGTVRVYGPNGHHDVDTQPGGMLLFDARCPHEVLAEEGAESAIDNHGKHAPGRTSIVFMCNMPERTFRSKEWISERRRQSGAACVCRFLLVGAASSRGTEWAYILAMAWTTVEFLPVGHTSRSLGYLNSSSLGLSRTRSHILETLDIPQSSL